MKRIIFELTMPKNNSWNGRWTGENKKYTIAKKIKDEKFKDLKSSYYYDFGDGWAASISLREAKPREKVTNKFFGYNWMVTSILEHGKIIYEY